VVRSATHSHPGRGETFLDEYRRVLAENGIAFDDRYLA